MGRNKMKVGKIEDKNKRMATFRKRRDGLFKKALEIHLLTGADVYLTVVNCDKQYRLNRLSGAAANPHLTVMDYSSQGSFQKSFPRTQISSDKPVNSYSSFDGSVDVCTQTSSNSEPTTHRETSIPSSVGQTRLRDHGTNADIMEMVKRHLEHMLADFIFKKELKKFAARTQACLQRSTNALSPNMSLTNSPKIGGNMQSVHCNSESILEQSALVSSSSLAPSYLQPVAIQSSTDLDDLLSTSEFSEELVSDADDASISLKAQLPTNQLRLPTGNTGSEQPMIRPTGLSFRLNTNESQFISPMSEYLEFINEDMSKAVPQDALACSASSMVTSPSLSSTSPSVLSTDGVSPPAISHVLLPTVADLSREFYDSDSPLSRGTQSVIG